MVDGDVLTRPTSMSVTLRGGVLPHAFNLCICKDNIHRYCVLFMLFVCCRRGVIMFVTSLGANDVLYLAFIRNFSLGGFTILSLVGTSLSDLQVSFFVKTK